MPLYACGALIEISLLQSIITYDYLTIRQCNPVTRNARYMQVLLLCHSEVKCLCPRLDPILALNIIVKDVCSGLWSITNLSKRTDF